MLRLCFTNDSEKESETPKILCAELSLENKPRVARVETNTLRGREREKAFCISRKEPLGL